MYILTQTTNSYITCHNNLGYHWQGRALIKTLKSACVENSRLSDQL